MKQSFSTPFRRWKAVTRRAVFFYDLCTPAELEGLVDRWRVAQLLVQNVPYRKIAEETNVSTATIVRVARFLHNGFDGYKTIMQRQGKL